MKRKLLIVALSVLAATVLLAAGGGMWAYSKGYYHAMRGGMVQDKDVDRAIPYFKVAYQKNPEAFMVAHDLACCYALKGDNESCFHWLRIALKSSYGDYAKRHAKTDHGFDSVRKTPEFQALIYDDTLQ